MKSSLLQGPLNSEVKSQANINLQMWPKKGKTVSWMQVSAGNGVNSSVYNFSTPPAVGTYPLRMGVFADVGQTYNSSQTMQRLLDQGSQVLGFFGDWSWASLPLICLLVFAAALPIHVYHEQILLISLPNSFELINWIIQVLAIEHVLRRFGLSYPCGFLGFLQTWFVPHSVHAPSITDVLFVADTQMIIQPMAHRLWLVSQWVSFQIFEPLWHSTRKIHAHSFLLNIHCLTF